MPTIEELQAEIISLKDKIAEFGEVKEDLDNLKSLVANITSDISDLQGNILEIIGKEKVEEIFTEEEKKKIENIQKNIDSAEGRNKKELEEYLIDMKKYFLESR